MFFEFITSFMNNIPYFNPPHSHDFMHLDDDVYCPTPYDVFSPCDYLEFIKIVNCDETLERDASYPFVVHDPILQYVEAFHEGQSWAMNTDIQIIGQNAQNLAFPTIVEFKTLVTIIVWQSPTFEPFISKSKCRKRLDYSLIKPNILVSKSTCKRRSNYNLESLIF